jgi:hypothetical protein
MKRGLQPSAPGAAWGRAGHRGRSPAPSLGCFLPRSVCFVIGVAVPQDTAVLAGASRRVSTQPTSVSSHRRARARTRPRALAPHSDAHYRAAAATQ